MTSLQDQIANCFINLLQIHSYEKITVQMICKETPLSRSTFYYHFENKEKLVEWICLCDFMKYCFPFFKINVDNINSKSFFIYIKDKHKFYQAIYRYDEGILLQRCLAKAYNQASTDENIFEYANPKCNNPLRVDPRIYRAYSDTGIAAIVVFWLSGGMKIPIEKIARDLTVMLTNSLEVVRDQYFL